MAAVSDKLRALVQRFDGWVSTSSGIGTSRDKSTSFTWNQDCLIDDETLESLFRTNDLARTIVTAIVKDALRQPPCPEPPESEDVDTTQEKSAALSKRLRELNALPKLKQALIWGRLFGGAALLKISEGKGTAATPEPEGAKLKDLIVVDKRDLTPASWYDNPLEDKYGKAKTYRLCRNGPATAASTGGVEIHETRMIMIPGMETTDRQRMRNSGWDDSIITVIYNAMQQSGGNWASVVAMFGDMSQKVYKLKGLIDGMTQDGIQVIQDRLANIDRLASVTRAIPLDLEETYEVVERGTLTGLGEIIDHSWVRLAAAANMPVIRLFRQTPGGLNATGNSDIRMWYDEVKDYQSDVVEPAFRAICQAADPSTEWEVSWPSLWQMSPTEEADFRNKVAQTDKLYIDAMVILPEEVALSRFGRGRYSPEYEIDLDARKASLERELESMETGEPTEQELAQQELAMAQAQGAAPGAEKANGETGKPGGAPGAKKVPDPKAKQPEVDPG